MASSLGKMPTTSERRLISQLRRSIGLVDCSLVRCCCGNGAHRSPPHPGSRPAWAAWDATDRRPCATMSSPLQREALTR
jgi:hypothetical protein